ncbi:hypothetical protein RE6C_01101 [Rhodopirellula europaea 6C]|uniref:Uncharacterized protein n=1 Tax=Rhodopirellula europaea 6C TaxID=1263867 RepID=M2B7H3_9BACT|nr:hypothetical protein RE6C_01101 [Rhodopirellula europaea 6C]
MNAGSPPKPEVTAARYSSLESAMPSTACVGDASKLANQSHRIAKIEQATHRCHRLEGDAR